MELNLNKMGIPQINKNSKSIAKNEFEKLKKSQQP